MRKLLPQHCSKRVLSLLLQVALVHLVLIGHMVLMHVLITRDTGSMFELIKASTLHWDARNYLKIAEYGYVKVGQIAFFPLFPFLIHALSSVFGDPALTALFINFVFHILGCYFLYRLVLLDYPERIARDAVYFFLIFPAAFVTVVPYTEALFFMLLTATVYSFRKEKFLAAGILGFLTTLTRITALPLLGFLLLEYLLEMRKTVDWKKILLPVLLPFVAIALYMVLNQLYYGDPLFFLEAQKKVFHKQLALPHYGFLSSWQSLVGRAPDNITLGFSNLLGASLIWIVSFYTFFKIRKSYGLFCLLTAFLLTFQAWWMSMLRYCLVVFPMYIFFANLAKNQTVRILLFACSLSLLAVFSTQFARGWWSM